MRLVNNLRVIVSLCKGGSTALLHSLAHAPDVTCYLQTVKSGQRTSGAPDYSVYEQVHDGIVLSKETIGHTCIADCTLRIFPSDDAIRATSPVFLFRDPVDTWASWARSGWGTLETFKLAYGHALALYDRARGLAPGVTGIHYEEFAGDPEAAFRKLCRILGIRFTHEMIHWRYRFPDQSPVIWRQDVQEDFDSGHADRTRTSKGFSYRRTDFVLAGHEVSEIERRFRSRYEELAR